MPLYDYECLECGNIKEVQHSISEIGIIEVRCDECGNLMKKKLSLPALIGFDNVGRSLTKKDREESPKENASADKDINPTANENKSAAKVTAKETTTKAETKKDTAN